MHRLAGSYLDMSKAHNVSWEGNASLMCPWKFPTKEKALGVGWGECCGLWGIGGFVVLYGASPPSHWTPPGNHWISLCQSLQFGKLYLYKKQIVNGLDSVGQEITYHLCCSHSTLPLECVNSQTICGFGLWPIPCGPWSIDRINFKVFSLTIKTLPSQALTCFHNLLTTMSFNRSLRCFRCYAE